MVCWKWNATVVESSPGLRAVPASSTEPRRSSLAAQSNAQNLLALVSHAIGPTNFPSRQKNAHTMTEF